MIKKKALTIVVLLASLAAQSQEFPSRLWHQGWLVTEDRDTVRGTIKYDMETNAVQVAIGAEKVNTYSSKKIMYFEIFDESLNNYRQFYSIPYQVNSNYKVPVLFEVLYEGPMTLLVQEKIVLETDPYNQSYYNAGPNLSRERLSYTYFFVDKSGKMMSYSGKKSELLEILYKNNDLVKKYIKDNRLKPDRMRDLVRITAFYNSL